MNRRIILLLDLVCSIIIIFSLFQTGFIYTLGGSPIEFPMYMSGAKPIFNIVIWLTALLCFINIIVKLISVIRDTGRTKSLSWAVIAFGIISLLSVCYTLSSYTSLIKENMVTNKMKGYEYGLGATVAEASEVGFGKGFYIMLLAVIILLGMQFVKDHRDNA